MSTAPSPESPTGPDSPAPAPPADPAPAPPADPAADPPAGPATDSAAGPGDADEAFADRVLSSLRSTSRRPWVRAVQVLFSLSIVVVLIGFVLPAVTGTTWGEIAGRLADVSGWHIATLVTLELAVLAVYSLTLIATVPGLRYRHAFETHNASTMIANSVPFGGALSLGLLYAMLRSFGFRRGTIALSVALTTLTDTVVKLALPVLGLAALALAGSAIPSSAVAAAVIGAVLGAMVLGTVIAVVASEQIMRALMTSLEETAQHAAGKLGKDPAAVRIVVPVLRFRRRATAILHRGAAVLFGAAGGMRVLQYVMFIVCLDAVGIELPLTAAFAAFTLGRLLAMMPLTPAGMGVTETGTAAALATLGADPGLAAAGVILYTLSTTVLQVPLGAASALTWSVRRRRITPYGRAAEAARDRAHADA